VISNQKKILITLSIALFASILFLFIGISFWFQHPQNNQNTVVLIQKGSSLSQISTTLSNQGVLDFPYIFKAILYSTAGWRDLKAGEYLIPANVTPARLIHILKSGDVVLHPLTVIEGETSYAFTQKLLKDERFQGTCEAPLEGSLLPETYHFPRGTERKVITARLEKEMKKALAEVWSTRKPDHALKSPEELLVLASIVEKETRLAKELPVVAAVFLNRLKQGMPLQADPTVLYGITKGKDEGKYELTLEDLKFESPHNTYLNNGLPPSPIANPGLATLKAVAAPADVNFLYFVADGSGGHVFATTLEEHQKNHAAWRKIREGKK